MRILSLVTLVSPLGEYGGPVRVALNQAKELARRGHEVTIAGAARGFDKLPATVEGVPAALFPARTIVPGIGFAGIAAPGLHRALKRLVHNVDIVHIHAARDLVTLPAADWMRRKGIPYALQTHGMIDPSTNPLAGPLDAWLTRRVLRGAKQIFYLTESEKRDLLAVYGGGSGLSLHELGNGVPLAPTSLPPKNRTEVLFLARLAPRKRPAAFLDMAKQLAVAFPAVTFRLVGPDEGEGTVIAERIAALNGSVDVRWEGPIAPDKAGDRLSRAAIYVLPAVDEPYPMSVLEAMSLMVPVVITDSCGLAPVVRDSGCGIVVDGSVDSLVEAVGRLLRDADLAYRMGEAGSRVTRQSLGMSAVAERLETAYGG